MKSAEATAHLDTLAARACAHFAASVLPVLPMEGLAVVLLDPEKEHQQSGVLSGRLPSKGSLSGLWAWRGSSIGEE